MQPCLVKQESFLLSEFQIVPIFLYSNEVSKYACVEQSLALSSRMKFPPHNFHLPSGSPS